MNVYEYTKSQAQTTQKVNTSNATNELDEVVKQEENAQLTQQPTQILYMGFNQTNTLFAFGTNKGFVVFSASPFKERTRNTFNSTTPGGGIGVVEMLFSSNIFALVGGGSNPAFPHDRVVLWDDQQKTCLGDHEIHCTKPVRAVKFHKNLLIVVLEDKIKVHDHELKELVKRETVPNPHGICAMSPDTESIVLAFPGVSPGSVRIDHLSSEKKLILKAHESEVVCIALNRDGSLLATASATGTLIRVFQTETGNKINEFRRGSSSAHIYSLAFSSDSKYLCCSSDTGTVHIWGVSQDANNRTSSLSVLGYFVDYVNSKWSMAEYKGIQGPSLCGFGPDSSTVYVLTAKGQFLVLKVDLETGEVKLAADKDVMALL
jgi:hypothetical protein